MSDGITPETLQESQELLQELFEEVKAQEGTLGDEGELGKNAEKIKCWIDTKVNFGNPRDKLIRLTPKLFEEVGVELDAISRQQMQDQYDFYYMTLTVSMRLGSSRVQFQRLACELDFDPKDTEGPIVHSIFPTSEWKEVLQWGGGMNLGLNSNLEWSAGVDTPEEIAGTDMPAHVKANIANKNSVRAAIVMPEFSYKLGRAEIAATGTGNSECFWRIDKPELQQAQTVQFGVVFKVPQGTTTLDLTGITWGEPSLPWLTADIRDVFEFLSAKWQTLFRQGDPKSLAKGDNEQWSLALPQ